MGVSPSSPPPPSPPPHRADPGNEGLVPGRRTGRRGCIIGACERFTGAGQAPGEWLPQAPGNLGSSCGPLAATAGPPFSCAPKWDFGSHGCTHSAPYSCSPPELERSLILQKITCLNHTHSTITPDPQDASHQFPPRPPSSSNTQLSQGPGSVGLKEALFSATVLDLVTDGQAGGRLPPWLPARPLAQEAPLQGHGTRSWIPGLNPKPRRPPVGRD